MSDGALGPQFFDGGDTIPEVSQLQNEVEKAQVERQRLFGRYLLERELGRGGMGVVWLATDEKLNISVALKFLPSIVAQDVEAIADLKKEILKGFALTHPGIVRLYSFEQDELYAAIVMEYIDGQSLTEAKLHNPGGCFDVVEIVPWVEQLCGVLAYAHEEARIVHRDLKPRNLMLTSRGRLKVADFGIASSISDTVSRASMKVSGNSSGTPSYMSPQQVMGDVPSPMDDIHALGATLYELLTGKPPFFTGNIIHQVLHKVPPTMAERRTALGVAGKAPIPASWEQTVAACLAKEPGERPASAREVWAMLQGTSTALPGAGFSSGAGLPATVSEFSEAATLPATAPQHSIYSGSEKQVPVSRSDVSEAGRDPTPLEEAHRQSPVRHRGILPIVVVLLLIALIAGVWLWRNFSERNRERLRRLAAAERRRNAGEVAKQPSSPINKPTGPTVVSAPSTAWMNTPLVATKTRPFENSLGMRFVPVPIVGGATDGRRVLFSVWETRRNDYEAFANAVAGMKRDWMAPGFSQGDDHPVVNVRWEDAKAFCAWLTRSERASRRIPQGAEYRLPTDHEWSCASGIGEQEEADLSPFEKNGRIAGYPWGSGWPPPQGSGNFNSGSHGDPFDTTAPVGKFNPNRVGLYDLSGNVAEWCDDLYSPEEKGFPVSRGGSWSSPLDDKLLRSSVRTFSDRESSSKDTGFRCVLVIPGIFR